jgi:hypothetical protein
MEVLYLAAPFYGDSPFSSGTLKNRIEIFKSPGNCYAGNC